MNVSSHSSSTSKKKKSRRSRSLHNVSKSKLSKSIDKQLEESHKEISLTQKVSENVKATATVDVNKSSHSSSTSKKEKSRRSRSSHNVSKRKLSKSLDKQLEGSDKKISLTQKVSENVKAKATFDVNKVEVNPSQSSKLRRSSLDKKQNKSRSLKSSLNSSLNSLINKTNKSKLKSTKRKRLNLFSSEEEENDDNSKSYKNELTQLQLGSGRKRVNPTYSTMVHIGPDFSDSCDECDDISVGNEYSDNSIDSDIKAEYNLDGITRTFSDDDLPGDDCRASESEYSDPDDNGSDLADFVVYNDEVVKIEKEEEKEENVEIDVEN